MTHEERLVKIEQWIEAVKKRGLEPRVKEIEIRMSKLEDNQNIFGKLLEWLMATFPKLRGDLRL